MINPSLVNIELMKAKSIDIFRDSEGENGNGK